jgi:hypothetical protein
MDLTVKLSELEKDLSESVAQEQVFHDRAILLRQKIKRLKTVLKDAEEALMDEETNAEESKASE